MSGSLFWVHLHSSHLLIGNRAEKTDGLHLCPTPSTNQPSRSPPLDLRYNRHTTLLPTTCTPQDHARSRCQGGCGRKKRERWWCIVPLRPLATTKPIVTSPRNENSGASRSFPPNRSPKPPPHIKRVISSRPHLTDSFLAVCTPQISDFRSVIKFSGK